MNARTSATLSCVDCTDFLHGFGGSEAEHQLSSRLGSLASWATSRWSEAPRTRVRFPSPALLLHHSGDHALVRRRRLSHWSRYWSASCMNVPGFLYSAGTSVSSRPRSPLWLTTFC